jgi:phosphoribosylglycinamide formyltransferase-1
MLHVAVFGSGRGSNFQAILDAMQRGALPGVDVRLALSNNSAAGILEIARAYGVPALHLSRRQFATEDMFVDATLEVLRAHGVNFIALAGYMKRLHPRVVRAYHHRIINVHPALLPAFGGEGMYGMHVHRAVLAAGRKVSGATVHLVDEEYDRGAIVLQRQVAVAPHETPESLAAKVLAVEHALYPEALKLFADGNVTIEENTIAVHT